MIAPLILVIAASREVSPEVVRKEKLIGAFKVVLNITRDTSRYVSLRLNVYEGGRLAGAFVIDGLILDGEIVAKNFDNSNSPQFGVVTTHSEYSGGAPQTLFLFEERRGRFFEAAALRSNQEISFEKTKTGRLA